METDIASHYPILPEIKTSANFMDDEQVQGEDHEDLDLNAEHDPTTDTDLAEDDASPPNEEKLTRKKSTSRSRRKFISRPTSAPSANASSRPSSRSMFRPRRSSELEPFVKYVKLKPRDKGTDIALQIEKNQPIESLTADSKHFLGRYLNRTLVFEDLITRATQTDWKWATMAKRWGHAKLITSRLPTTRRPTIIIRPSMFSLGAMFTFPINTDSEVSSEGKESDPSGSGTARNVRWSGENAKSTVLFGHPTSSVEERDTKKRVKDSKEAVYNLGTDSEVSSEVKKEPSGSGTAKNVPSPGESAKSQVSFSHPTISVGEWDTKMRVKDFKDTVTKPGAKKKPNKTAIESVGTSSLASVASGTPSGSVKFSKGKKMEDKSVDTCDLCFDPDLIGVSMIAPIVDESCQEHSQPKGAGSKSASKA